MAVAGESSSPRCVHRGAGVVAARMALLYIGFVSLACGTSATAEEAQRGLVRVEVARLEVADRSPTGGDEASRAERRHHFRSVIDEAASLQEYGLAAEAATYWGEWEGAAQRWPQAEAAFRTALRYDKLEQQRLRSDTNPRANSAQLAISLANVSRVLEEQDQLEEAVFYADRAFRINRALNLRHRIRLDTDRLAELYDLLGNELRAEEVRTLGEELLAEPDEEETVEED